MGKSGVLEVSLVDANGVTDNLLFGGLAAYVVIQYKDQTQKSKVVEGNGGNPVWNEKFKFKVEETDSRDHHKLVLKLMDDDSFNADDYLGQTTLYLKEVVKQGLENGSAKLHPIKHIVVDNDKNYCGEIRLGITLTS